MTTHIDLDAETVAFVRMRMMEVIGEDQENLKRVELNMKEVKEQIFRLFYDYQIIRGWPHVAERTSDILGMSRAHVYEMLKKYFFFDCLIFGQETTEKAVPLQRISILGIRCIVH